MKIVIVEDEIRIREGIIKLIQRVSKDYKIVGEAENGREGLTLIQESRPNLVITDIKMPIMDGIEMLLQLKQQGIFVKAIILSAYSEFAYAQQAIELGVTQYLIKPIAVHEFTQALENVESQLEREHQNLASHPEVLNSIENVFYSILLGSMQINEEVSRFLANSYKLDANGDFAVVSVYLGDKYTENKEKVMKSICLVLKEKPKLRYCLLELPQSRELLIIIYDFADLRIIERWFQTVVLPRVKRDINWGICFGWIHFRGLSGMKDSINILRKHLDWNIVLGDEIMISYPKVTQIQFAPLSYPINIENRIRTVLCVRDNQKLQKEINSFVDYFQKGRLFSPREIKESFVRFCWMIINVAKEINFIQYEHLEQQDLLEKIISSVTWNELEQTVHLLLELIPKTSETIDNASSFVVQRAKGMVHEFYNQGITLNEIASKLNITPEYLGTQFHKEIGVNFSAYIKEYRIKKAKEMLIGKNVKLREIAKKVGYNDPKYFSRVFKELTNQTPGEYRKIHR